MNASEIVQIATDLLVKYGDRASNRNFGHWADWTIKVTKPQKSYWFGSCNFVDKVIIINDYFAANGSREDVVDTIRHEVAHALAGVEYSRTGRQMGHGRLWKRWATIVGANPKAKSKSSEGLDYQRRVKWVVVEAYDAGYRKIAQTGRKLKNLELRYPKGKPHKKGCLYHVAADEWSNYESGKISRLKLVR